MRKRRSGTGRPRPGRAPLARYSNYFEVGHNPYEFLIDFGQFQPEEAEVVLHTRIAVGPTHAKMLNQTLGSAVDQYESDHGPIPQPVDAFDAMDAVLRSVPDFELRAADARRLPGATPALAPARRPSHKR
jgi:hypothetical protein